MSEPDTQISHSAAVDLLLFRGNFEIDELYLRKHENITDFSKYVFQVDPKNPKIVSDEDIGPDFFVPETVWKEIANLRGAKAKL